jgi:hypothetical protein
VLRDGINIMLVPDPRDTRELAERLRRLIEDPSRARAIGLRSPYIGCRKEDDRLAAATQERALLRALALRGQARERDRAERR